MSYWEGLVNDMSLTRGYSQMTDSGVPWLGQYPAHWKCCKVKNTFFATKTIVGDKSDDYERLALTLNGVIKRSKVDAGGLQPEKFETYQILCENELVFKLIDLQNIATSRVGRSPFTGIVSPAYIILHERNNRSTKYAEYYFLSMWMNQVFNQLGADGVRSNIGASALLNIPFLLPPESEQETIANYLDDEIKRINSIIAEAKASIEEYKSWKASIIYEAVTKGLDPNVEMRDSGVEWVGKMPKTWSTCSLKLLTTKIGSGKTPSGGADVYTTEGVMFLRSQNIYNTGLEIDSVSFISNEIDESMSSTRVKYEDVLLNITGGSIGRCCLYDLEGIPANVNQHVCILRTDKTKLLPQYLRYFWNSASGPMVVAQYQTGGNRQGLNFEQIGSTKIPFCSIEEQKNIVDYLDIRCGEIDTLIKEKEVLISDLESYKKSLIFEVVTGKRKVV